MMKSPRQCYEFGPFRLDPSERQLLRAGQVMPHIDRTNLESNYGAYSGEYDAGEYGYEFESDQEFETYGPFSEAEEMELAAELLSVSDEAELEQFLGGLIKKAGRAVGGVIKSPLGQALGSAAGNALLPGVGGVVGGKLASASGKMFGLDYSARFHGRPLPQDAVSAHHRAIG
jgi:hypothetical protein